MSKFGELLEFFRKVDDGIRYVVSFEISFEEFKVRYTIQPKAESWQIELIVQEEGTVCTQNIKEFETFSKAFEEVVGDMEKIKQQFLMKLEEPQ